MKRGSLFIFILSLVLVMSLGIVSAVCGNGTVDTGHVCDDGNTDNETECAYGSATCVDTHCQDDCLAWLTGLIGSYCGDGITDTSDGEICDDGNTVSGDGCSADCQEVESDIQVIDVTVPTDTMCGDNSGLKCDETAADNYCKDGMTYKYDGYVTNSKVCIDATTTSASKADAANAAIGSCDSGLIIGDHQWITNMKCYKTAGVAEPCTGTATSCEEIDSLTDSDKQIMCTNQVGCTLGAGGTICYDEATSCSSFTTSGTCGPASGEPQYGCTWQGPPECTDDNDCPDDKICSDDGVCVAIGGLFCPDNGLTGDGNLPRLSPRDRAENDTGLYYCGLDEIWHKAKPRYAKDCGTDTDAICITDDDPATSPAKCVANYECISNSCADGLCFSVREELSAQRNFIYKIWCMVSNMISFIQENTWPQEYNKTSEEGHAYCGCLAGLEGSDANRCIIVE